MRSLSAAAVPLKLLLVCASATAVSAKRRSVEGNAPIAFPSLDEQALKSHWKKAKEMGYMVVHAEQYRQNRKDCYKPQKGDRVEIMYEGRLRKSGKVFDRSPKDKPFSMDVGANPVRVIRAWDWGVKELCWHTDRKVGEKATLLAASDWAYGSAGSAGNFESIGKNADLVFDMEIVGIEIGGAGESSAGVITTESKNAAGEKVVKLGNKKEKKSKARPGSPAAFFDAVLDEDFPLMEKLLAEYPEYLNLKDDMGTARSAMMDAAVNGKEDAAIWLIEKGCDVTIGENSGFNALDAAAYRGSPRLVKALLDAGLDPYRAAPRDGYLAMHRCCFSHQTNGKQLEALMEFDKFGVDMQARSKVEDEDGNPFDSDFPGKNCLDMAIERQQTGIVEYLRNHASLKTEL